MGKHIEKVQIPGLQKHQCDSRFSEDWQEPCFNFVISLSFKSSHSWSCASTKVTCQIFRLRNTVFSTVASTNLIIWCIYRTMCSQLKEKHIFQSITYTPQHTDDWILDLKNNSVWLLWFCKISKKQNEEASIVYLLNFWCFACTFLQETSLNWDLGDASGEGERSSLQQEG